jgi:phosphoribosylamine--glycine ligase
MRQRKPRALPESANVLLVGTGGREHALAWKLKQSSHLGTLWVESTGNAGLLQLGRPCPESLKTPLNNNDTFRLRKFCEEEKIDLVVVGPEAPLADGLADILASEKTLVFGPTASGAKLEADKGYAKQLMRTAAIATAEGRTFTDRDSALHYLEQRDEPCVVKASGLAAGKGVIVCSDRTEAVAAVESIMGDRSFGSAGDRIVIEERLQGQEVSVLALVDGHSIWILDPAQDHKQVGEGDTGPNTGGMGAYCPTPLATDALMEQVQRDILVPIVDALRRDGINYRGVLYAGLMLTSAGPKVLEFNVRFGDPECQPLMMRLQGDLLEILWRTAAGSLDEAVFDFSPKTACTVVMCSEGYPGSYRKGLPIRGLDEAAKQEDVVVFHAGTRLDPDGRVSTNGGRVLGVTALADELRGARDRANDTCGLIQFDGAFYRHDIGERVLTPA